MLVPVFNGAATVEAALRSLQRQTLADIRIIVIDDGSTDGTSSILARIAACDERVDIVRQNNRGIVDALNLGLALATAPIIARHDSDDIASPARLETQLRYLTEHADCIAVSCRARHIDGDGCPLGTVSRVRDPAAADPRWFPAREPYLLHPFLMVRRDAMIAIGGYRAVLHAEDSDLYWRLATHGRLHNLRDVLGDYRVHARSVSGTSIANGRIMAINSQLAAISAVRRAEGKPDDVFTRSDAAHVDSRISFGEMIARAGEPLTESERTHLAAAAAAKLLELASYRPYEPELADCRVARRVLDGGGDAPSKPNRAALREYVVMTAVRLLLKGQVRAALALVPSRLLPIVGLRLVFRVAVPERIKVLAKRATGRLVAAG